MSSIVNSYEDLELTQVQSNVPTEKTPLDIALQPRKSIRKLARQQSVMDTQKASDGTMQMTYWF